MLTPYSATSGGQGERLALLVGVCTRPSSSALWRSQRRAGSTVHVSRAEHTAYSPSLSTVCGESERRPRPGQLGAPATRAHATAAQPVPQ